MASMSPPSRLDVSPCVGWIHAALKRPDSDWYPIGWPGTNEQREVVLNFSNLIQKVDSLSLGPLPLGWVIPDPEFTPTRPSAILFPGFIFHSYFKQWGNNDTEMIFLEGRRIILLVKFSKRDVMAQAALALAGARYMSHLHEITPINLGFGNFQELKKQCLASQNSFSELTRGLTGVQKKGFTELMRNMDRLERENEALGRDLKNLQEKKTAREKFELERQRMEIDGVPLEEIVPLKTKIPTVQSGPSSNGLNTDLLSAPEVPWEPSLKKQRVLDDDVLGADDTDL